jgi:mono/diheme cytochrome c family protein
MGHSSRRIVAAALMAAITGGASLQPSAAGQPQAADNPAPPPEIKGLFASYCSWCHGSYGMSADKGPRLAGTQLSEAQVEDRIRNGKEGYMPSFGKDLTAEQIKAFALYIKSLKPQD